MTPIGTFKLARCPTPCVLDVLVPLVRVEDCPSLRFWLIPLLVSWPLELNGARRQESARSLATLVALAVCATLITSSLHHM
eukprot:6175518-Pleurochrysis_carterae.AAC.1